MSVLIQFENTPFSLLLETLNDVRKTVNLSHVYFYETRFLIQKEEQKLRVFADNYSNRRRM